MKVESLNRRMDALSKGIPGKNWTFGLDHEYTASDGGVTWGGKPKFEPMTRLELIDLLESAKDGDSLQYFSDLGYFGFDDHVDGKWRSAPGGEPLLKMARAHVPGQPSFVWTYVNNEALKARGLTGMTDQSMDKLYAERAEEHPELASMLEDERRAWSKKTTERLDETNNTGVTNLQHCKP